MYFDIPRAGSRTFNSLTQDLVTNAIASSPDGGLTIVLSKLDLSDVPVDAVYLLARTGKTKPDDDCTIERMTLGNNRLSTLPTEFISLSRLRYLNLKHNSFTRFPEVVTILPALDTLDISHNKITAFPPQPGQLLQLRVFSFARNKITQLPNYFPQFRNLEVLKLERNPVEWPPKDIIHYDAKSETEGDMKTWITGIQEWIEYHVSFQDDSGYGETIEFKGTQEKHKPWQFPKRQASVDIDSSIHSRSFSVDSNASMNSDSFVDTHVASTNVEWPPKTDRPMMNFDSHHPSRDVYLGSPADSDTFDTRSTSSRPELSDAWHSSQLQSHLRTSSVTEPRQPVHTLGPAKSSLPDIHSPRWRLDSQPSSPEIPAPILQTLQPSISQNSARSIETRSDATPTSKTPSMAFERNSYFQRLSTMPQSVKLPAPLFCLVETARSILFVTSQIYQTIEHYANHAIDEKHAAVFRKVLEPANNDMMQLIRALDRYDTSSRKGTPSGPICRTLIESCRNTIAVTHKAVGLFAIQLRIAPCEDFRYSRWILLELYASTAEISVTWQNLVPHSDALKGFLSGKSGSLLSIPDPSTSSATRSDSLYPMARLRTNDLSAIRTHNARRHAGSFSHRDVEIGKDLPNYDEPPILPSRTPVSALRAMPKRQATAPPSMFSPGGSSSNITVPPVPLSRSTTEDTANSRRGHRLDDSIEPQQSLPRQKSVPRLKSFDLNADSRVRVDSGVIQATLESLEATSQLWDTFEDSQASADLQIQDSLTRVRELSKKVSLALRVALDNDCSVDRYLFEDTVALSKAVNQLSRSNNRSRPTLARGRSQIARLNESLDEFVKLLHLPSTSVGRSSPAFSNPFPLTVEDNRLGSSLSRTRSAQPTPTTLKTQFTIGNDAPSSAMPISSGYKVPSISRLPSREPWSEPVDPG